MNEKIYEVDSHRLSHPSSTIIAGSSMSGKSVFTKKLLDNISYMYNPVPTRIILSFSEDQPIYNNMRHNNIVFVKGLEFDYDNPSNEPTLLILDDQMRDASKSGVIQDLFTKGVHHRNFSLILITQNLFNQGRFARDMRLNAHYYFIFKSPMFQSQVHSLNRQLYPLNPGFLEDAYKKSTIEPFSYMFLNLHPRCNDDLRVSSGILPSEEETIFLPK